jgi:hypothetical protein
MDLLWIDNIIAIGPCAINSWVNGIGNESQFNAREVLQYVFDNCQRFSYIRIERQHTIVVSYLKPNLQAIAANSTII